MFLLESCSHPETKQIKWSHYKFVIINDSNIYSRRKKNDLESIKHTKEAKLDNLASYQTEVKTEKLYCRIAYWIFKIE